MVKPAQLTGEQVMAAIDCLTKPRLPRQINVVHIDRTESAPSRVDGPAFQGQDPSCVVSIIDTDGDGMPDLTANQFKNTDGTPIGTTFYTLNPNLSFSDQYRSISEFPDLTLGFIDFIDMAVRTRTLSLGIRSRRDAFLQEAKRKIEWAGTNRTKDARRDLFALLDVMKGQKEGMPTSIEAKVSVTGNNHVIEIKDTKTGNRILIPAYLHTVTNAGAAKIKGQVDGIEFSVASGPYSGTYNFRAPDVRQDVAGRIYDLIEKGAIGLEVPASGEVMEVP